MMLQIWHFSFCVLFIACRCYCMWTFLFYENVFVNSVVVSMHKLARHQMNVELAFPTATYVNSVVVSMHKLARHQMNVVLAFPTATYAYINH